MIAAGRTLALIAIAAVFADQAGAAWRRADAGLFSVYAQVSDRTAREFAVNIYEFDQVLRLLFNAPQPEATSQPLEINLLKSNHELRRIFPNASSDTVGLFLGEPFGTYAFATFGRSAMPARQVVFHEYTHYFMARFAPGVYPQWFSEGMAEFAATTEISGGRAVLGRVSDARAITLNANRAWLSPDAVFERSPASFNASDRSRFYAQAWLYTHFFLADPDRRQWLIRYLAALGEGAAANEVTFEAATGLSYRAFARQIRRYWRRGAPAFAFPVAARETEVRVSALTPAASEVRVPALAAALFRPDDPDKADLLAEIRDLAALYPDAPAARRALALAEARFGDAVRARALYRDLIAADPDAASLHFELGLAWLRDSRAEGRFENARAAFVEAFNRDPQHYPTLFSYGWSFLYDPDAAVDDHVVAAITQARALAPHVSEIALLLARALMTVERFEDAIAILEPWANDPHKRLPFARDWIADAEAGLLEQRARLAEAERPGNAQSEQMP